jgi:hypothetical protein
MDINSFLFLRTKYEKIIEHIDSMNSELDEVNIFLNDNDKNMNNIEKEFVEILSHKKLKYEFLQKKTFFLSIKNILDNHIKNKCNHEFITDVIDINPDESKTITYCKFCEYTRL